MSISYHRRYRWGCGEKDEQPVEIELLPSLADREEIEKVELHTDRW